MARGQHHPLRVAHTPSSVQAWVKRSNDQAGQTGGSNSHRRVKQGSNLVASADGHVGEDVHGGAREDARHA
eukprot:1140134-Rhodomonas_salina.3